MDRFWSKVDVRGLEECWPWQASVIARGYGTFNFNGRVTTAQRVAWELTYGPIKEGMFICHHCDNPGCCNPAHLFEGTPSDNVQDAIAKGRIAQARHGTISKYVKGCRCDKCRNAIREYNKINRANNRDQTNARKRRWWRRNSKSINAVRRERYKARKTA